MHYSHHNSPNIPKCHVSRGSNLLPSIPMASSIVPQLEAIGLLPAAASKVSDTYLKAARDLHAVCEASLRNAYQKASNGDCILHEDLHAIYKALNDTYVRQTGIWASNALTSARNAVNKATSVHETQTVKEKKPMFHHEYTPLLDKYFEYNAYPSAPDRAVLARKSMMTPRQIEVWFQNHRNRARKEGKTLRKLTETPLPVDLPLKSLEEKMPFFTVPADQRKPLNNRECTLDEPLNNELSPTTLLPTPAPSFASDTDILNPPRSPCAFPAVYTPCDASLSCTQPMVYKFPPPLWYRKPATHNHLPQTQIDMYGFTLEFSQKLHLRAPAPKSHRFHASHSWCAGRYIPWCPAPHPALIRSPRAFLKSTPTKRIQVIPASTSHQHAFGSPSSSLFMTLVSSKTSSDPTPRKAGGLPKRVPKSKSLSHRGGSPAISENSPEPSLLSSSSSCISSDNSEMTTRRPSSSSSCSSSSSPTTPVSSPPVLPGDTDPTAILVSGIDFDFTGDSVDNPSEIQTSFALSDATQPKHRFPFAFLTHLSRNDVN